MCFKEVFLPCYSVLSIEEPTYFSPQARLGLTGPWGKCEGRLQFTKFIAVNHPLKKKYRPIPTPLPLCESGAHKRVGGRSLYQPTSTVCRQKRLLASPDVTSTML